MENNNNNNNNKQPFEPYTPSADLSLQIYEDVGQMSVLPPSLFTEQELEEEAL